jgi:hypothetical protein
MEECAQGTAKAFDIDVSIQPAIHGERNLSTLLRDDDRDGIRLLGNADAGAVACAELGIGQVLAKGKNTPGSEYPVATDDNRSVVQRRVREEDVDQELLCEGRIEGDATIRVVLKTRFTLDDDEGTIMEPGQLRDSLGNLLDRFLRLRFVTT